MAPNQYEEVTPEQIEHFLAHGWVRIPACFTREQAENLTSTIWTRLGYSPTDKATWLREKINMPGHTRWPLQSFAPKAWRAICDLLGGEDRIDPESATWGDGWIINLGKDEYESWPSVNPRELDNWHVDGDFFMHYLDSPEQGLLIIPLFSDIKPNGGGTYIAPDGIPFIAKHLHDHPEGTTPRMLPRGQELTPEFTGTAWWIKRAKEDCKEFAEMTGDCGDVILMHPFMMHSASKNILRLPRIITNPPVSLREPFNYNRTDGSEYSLVERKTLNALGVDSLPDWKITATRDRVIPERLKVQAKMKEDEERRLKGEQVAPTDLGGTAADNHRLPTGISLKA